MTFMMTLPLGTREDFIIIDLDTLGGLINSTIACLVKS